jgi:hypothetical protein
MAEVTVAKLVADIMTDLGDTEMTEDDVRDFVRKAVVRLNGKLAARGIDTQLSIDDECSIDFPADIFQALLVMQTECLIAKKDHFEAVSKGIRIRSGQDEVDTTAGFGGYGDVSTSICEELEDLLDAYQEQLEKEESETEYGAIANYGQMVWYGNQRKYEEADHDGQYSEPRKHPFDSEFDDQSAKDL